MRKQITKTTAEGTLVITASDEGTSWSNRYFSITAELYEAGKQLTYRNIIACGCMREEILKAAPELKPLVDIHLSKLDGIPMHAEENGWYWLAKAARIKQQYEPQELPEECLKIFSEHCRISLDKAKRLVALVKAEPEEFSARCLWRKKCEAMKKRWSKEALAATKLLVRTARTVRFGWKVRDALCGGGHP